MVGLLDGDTVLRFRVLTALNKLRAAGSSRPLDVKLVDPSHQPEVDKEAIKDAPRVDADGSERAIQVSSVVEPERARVTAAWPASRARLGRRAWTRGGSSPPAPASSSARRASPCAPWAASTR